MDAPKADRLEALFEAMTNAPVASTFDEAFELLCQTLNQVEDRMTSIPYNPNAFETDGRMYPPENDNRRVVAGHENVIRFRSLGHNTFISSNGAIEIQLIPSERVIFTKPGKDGKQVWE
jgi:hypothetical protein